MRLFKLYNAVQMQTYTVIAIILTLCFPVISFCAETGIPKKSSPADITRQAAADGKIAYKLTTPDKLKALFGPAEHETVRNDGGMEILELKYPDIQFIFGRMRRYSTPSTLLWINAKGRQLDIGQERQIVLRNEDDLKKFDPFWGFANVSLANLNLRNHLQLLETMPFDSRTKWPGSDKLPDGFDPAQLLEDGKNPDDPASYQSGKYGVRPDAVLVPASNRTTAGHAGRDVYTFWREAGMGWATPYLAGLAVLAFQVNPEIEPKTIVTLLQKTAVQTSVGAVVQPVDFIKAVRDTQRK